MLKGSGERMEMRTQIRELSESLHWQRDGVG